MHVETYFNVDLSSSAQVKIHLKVKLNFELFWKKIKFFGSHVVVLMKTFPLTYQLLMQDWYWRRKGDFVSQHTETRGSYRQNSISNFLKFFHIFGFPRSTREDHPIDVSICNVGLILTKLRWLQLFVKSQNSNFFEKNQIFGFPRCSTREDLSIDVSITNVGLILTKLRWLQLFVKSQTLTKKIKFLGFHGVVLVKTFPSMYQLLM